MTVDELRRKLFGVAGDLQVVIEIMCDDDRDLIQADCLSADAEERCADGYSFYLFGEKDCDDD